MNTYITALFILLVGLLVGAIVAITYINQTNLVEL